MSENFNIFALNLINVSMKLKNETTITTVHPETAEIVTETVSKTFTVKTNSEEFYMVFLTLLKDVMGLKSAVDIKVLYALCNQAEFNTGKVSMSTGKRKEIMEFIGITYNTLANSLCKLKKLGFITDKDRDYTINPKYFWKGDLATRERSLKEGRLSINIEFNNE